jgi:hypothetical protein
MAALRAPPGLVERSVRGLAFLAALAVWRSILVVVVVVARRVRMPLDLMEARRVGAVVKMAVRAVVAQITV